jgi:hypothetical protein
MATKPKKLKTFLCQEGSEKFHIEAESLKQAQEDASMWNAVVVKEVKSK